MLPVEFPIRMREASTAALVLTLRDVDGQPVALTDWDTASCHVKTTASEATPAAVFTATIDGVAGQIVLQPPVPNTLTVGRYIYDVVLTSTTAPGELLPVVTGSLTVFAGVTVL